MFKQIVLGTVLTAFACLAEEQAPVTPTARVEVLAVRVVQFFNTFDVEVHRAVMTKNAAGSVGDLKVVGKVAVSDILKNGRRALQTLIWPQAAGRFLLCSMGS